MDKTSKWEWLMERAAFVAWRAMLLCFLVFVVLAVLRLTFLSTFISNDMVWPPLIGGIVLAVIMAVCDFIGGWWWLHRERLQAWCFGFSFKPFHWRLGDVTGPDYSGRWWALGPFCMGGKVRP